MKQAVLIAGALAGALLIAPAAWSQAKAAGPLASELQARKVVKTADGREELTSAVKRLTGMPQARAHEQSQISRGES